MRRSHTTPSPGSPARSVHKRSGYHAWKRRRPSARSLADAALAERIEAIHEASRGIYGAPRIQAELADDHAICVGKKRVARLMRDLGIQGVAAKRRPRGRPSGMEAPAAPDLVRRDFTATAPDQLSRRRHHLRRHLGGLRSSSRS